jgi:ribonuclease VapC
LIFVDASAMVALLCREPQMIEVARVIDSKAALLTSPFAMLEAAFAVVHRKGYPPREAAREVSDIVSEARMDVAAVEPYMFEVAITAFERFGKGRHPAKLNIGDCLAYAVAKANNASILFVGDDFSQTDLPNALVDGT